MGAINAQAQWQDNSGRGTATGLRPAIALGHLNDLSGAVFLLPPFRNSAGSLPLSRATSQALRFNSACLGLYHLNAIQNVCRQASTDLFRVRVHLKSLSCSASSSAERKARKAFHDGEKASHESGQSSQERSHV
ncbi:hypothetical protein OF122_13085 [Pelagibacterium flavum]|uniref:Uncharacterized protein n=1 Tax=Pelagibacterium flavum TaxID=2984530 RepID=A0ABY6IK88_9HYPH|nr:hypothetical protein [Pelagibacterium sp. YIM 151497]UYQ70993.1 hypothetical protein OF122_13085 [Pelagibacterium sp. YIM 151497]